VPGSVVEINAQKVRGERKEPTRVLGYRIVVKKREGKVWQGMTENERRRWEGERKGMCGIEIESREPV